MRNKLVIGAFLLMLLSFVVILSLPADKESVAKENRAMATIPEANAENIFSGDFATGFGSFLGDHIGLRSFLTDLSKGIDALKGIVPDTGKIVSTNKDIGTGTTQKQTLLVADNTVMEMFIRNKDYEKIYTDTVNHYAEKLPENIRLYNMIVPTQLEFKEPIYKNLQDSQKDAIDTINQGLSPRVTAVDAYGALERHTDEYIYFRTDHHWTPLGAYYAYEQFMKQSGGVAVNKDDFEKNKISRVLGYLYDKVEIPEIASMPDTIEWYDVDPTGQVEILMHDIDKNGKDRPYKGVMYDRSKADYSFFFGSDHPVVEMANNSLPDGKTIVLLKESYSNVLAPWLIKSYRKVILDDPRIYEGSFQTVIEKFNPDEVMIVNYIFTTNFPDYCGVMKNMY
ncbi:MAG: hypothetical protein IJX57_07410 [Clostridia bacterium]|nr:hypothetical protein [Clostridia bacterium]